MRAESDPARCGSLQADVMDQPLASSSSHEEAFQLAMAHKSEGRLAEAEAKLQEALQSAPGNPAYHFELANVYALQHDTYQDIPPALSDSILRRVAYELDQTLMLDPEFLPARYNLAVTHKRLGDYERSREELRRLREKAQSRGDAAMQYSALMQTGRVYQEQGFFDEARDSFLAARQLDEMNPESRDALANLAMHQNWKENKTQRANMGQSLNSMQQNLAQMNARGSSYPGYGGYPGQDPRARQAATSGQMMSSLGGLLAQQFAARGARSSEGRRERYDGNF